MDTNEHGRLARSAAVRGDWIEALALWDAVMEQDPASPIGLLGKGEALLDMGELAKAEAVFAEAMDRFPSHVWAAANNARIAVLRQEWQEALQRWQSVRDKFPQDPVGYLGCGEVLRDQGDLGQAEVVFAEAMKRFPEQVWAAANHAVIATRRQDWQEALRRWQKVRDRFPHEPMGYIGYGEALRDIGRIDEAERTFSEAEQRFPDNDLAAINLARIASRRGERAEAIRRWEAAKARFPFNALIFIGLAEAFSGFEQFGAADEVLAQAVESFPANESVWVAYARVAMQRHHWDAALHRWDLLLQRFPQHRIGYAGKADALLQAGQFDAVKVTLEEALRLFPGDPSLA